MSWMCGSANARTEKACGRKQDKCSLRQVALLASSNSAVRDCCISAAVAKHHSDTGLPGMPVMLQEARPGPKDTDSSMPGREVASCGDIGVSRGIPVRLEVRLPNVLSTVGPASFSSPESSWSSDVVAGGRPVCIDSCHSTRADLGRLWTATNNAGQSGRAHCYRRPASVINTPGSKGQRYSPPAYAAAISAWRAGPTPSCPTSRSCPRASRSSRRRYSLATRAGRRCAGHAAARGRLPR